MDYFKMYKSVWDFHKKFADVKEDNKYWESVVEESTMISKQYNECKFIVELLLAVVTELERVYKEKYKK